MTLGTHCSFIPPYLLERIAASDPAAADHCRATVAHDQQFRAGREVPPQRETAAPPVAGGPAWVVDTRRSAES